MHIGIIKTPVYYTTDTSYHFCAKYLGDTDIPKKLLHHFPPSKIMFCQVFLFLLNVVISVEYNCTLHTLRLLHVVVRHGDSTPSTTYPNDIYTEGLYNPTGPNRLTEEGKMRSYMVGKELRNRYDVFLGPTHYFDQIVATSSSQPKCKASTQAILTTLFPAKEYCHEGKLVDYSYINANDDRILLTYLPCQKYLGQLQFSKGCSCKERNYVNLLVSERSGWDNVSLLQLMQVKETIKAQEELDLDIPQWAKPIWKEPLWKCSRNLWRALAADKKSLSYIGGHLFSKVVSDSMHKAQGNTRNLRLLLYTAHDFNLVALLGILGLYRDQEIGYSEYIAFELHEIDCIVGFKVYHQDYLGSEPKLLCIPNCGTFCPIETFIDLATKYFPNDWCDQH